MELKYIVFMLAVIGTIPLVYLLLLSQKSIKICVFLIPLILIKYQETSINFFTNPGFKGTASGYEVSLIHLISIALLLAMILRRWPIKFLFPGNLLYFLYFFVCLLSLSAAPNKIYAGFELMKMLTLFLVFLAVTNYLYITHDFDSFLNGIAMIIIFSFLIALKMKYLEGRIARGIFAHQNSAGMFMCLLGPIYLARLLNKKDSLLKAGFYLFVFIASFLSALFTYSRGALACFPLGCAVVILFSLALHLTFKTIIVIFVTGLISIAAIGYSAPNIINRFVNATGASAEMRKMLASTAINIIRDKPLLGCGVNNWGIVATYPNYNPYRANDTKGQFKKGEYINPVETVYLLVGAECGLIGLGTLFLWYFYYLYQAVYQAYRWRKTDYFYLLAGLGGGFTSNYLQSTLEWCLKQPINFCTLFCCFGIIAVLVQRAREHTTLSYLELVAIKRAEYYRQLEMAAAAEAEEHMERVVLEGQLEQPLDQPSDHQNQ